MNPNDITPLTRNRRRHQLLNDPLFHTFLTRLTVSNPNIFNQINAAFNPPPLTTNININSSDGSNPEPARLTHLSGQRLSDMPPPPPVPSEPINYYQPITLVGRPSQRQQTDNTDCSSYDYGYESIWSTDVI